jgi:membrane protein implicated in regulation of membrane protease activity
MLVSRIKILGWVFLIVGGIGTIVSALIGSDWPMYSFIIISSSGAALIIYFRKQRKTKENTQGLQTPDILGTLQ